MSDNPIWQEITDIGATTSYYGYALKGTATSAASWWIKRIVRSGDNATEQWASDSPDQVWDNRASLSYS